MAYNNGREDRKWRIWKEAEEKVLREHGVDEATIEQIRIDDRADFNSNRRFYHWTSDFGEYLEGMADREQSAGAILYLCAYLIFNLPISPLVFQNTIAAIWLSRFCTKVKGNKIQNGGGKDIGFPFRRVKAGIKKAVTQKNALRSCPQR